FVDAWRVVGAAAVTERDLAVLEVAQKLLPLFVGRRAVLLGGAQPSTPGDEGPVTVDDLLRIYGFVSHGGVDVSVACDQLGDVGWHAVHDRVGDEDPSEVVERVAQGAAADVLD